MAVGPLCGTIRECRGYICAYLPVRSKLMPSSSNRPAIAHKAIWALLIIGVAARVVIALYYAPSYYPDSRDYLQFADQIQRWDFTNYTGMRTPAYPLLLALTGSSATVVWLIQMILGLATAAFLFSATLRQSTSPALAFLLGLIFLLTVNHLFFEAAILTETLSTFFLLLSWWQMGRMFQDRQFGARSLLLLSVITTLAWLTRPLLLVLAPLFGALLVSRLRKAPSAHYGPILLCYVVPIVAAIIGWCMFNQVVLGYFGISTTLGLNLVNHSGALIQDAPPEYSDIKDVFLQRMARQKPGPTSHVMVIWDTYPAMMEKTGLSFAALSQRLARMSITLFLQHPQAYLASVYRAWLTFWESTIYWYPNDIASAQLREWLTSMLDIQERLRALVNALFGFAALSLVSDRVRRRISNCDMIVLTIAIVAVGSVVQAFLEYGENARYAVPFQPLILWTVFIWIKALFTRVPPLPVSAPDGQAVV